jgi:biotin operon repressor
MGPDPSLKRNRTAGDPAVEAAGGGPITDQRVMKYYLLAAGAILFAACLLAIQIVGGMEYTEGGTPYTRVSMVAVMLSVAILPIFLHAAWRMSKGISMVLILAFVSLLAYSLPAQIGRVGEIKEAKVIAQGDAKSIESSLASIHRTLRSAHPDMATECLGAPDPLPPRGWPECRRKRGTVTALQNESARLQNELRAVGKDRIGDLGSETLAWALSPLVTVKASAIRKGSGVALAVGLEMAIWSLVWLASIAFTTGISARSSITPIPDPQPLTADDPPSNGGRSQQTIDDLLLPYIDSNLNQQQIAKALGVGTATVSRHLDRLERDGSIARHREGKAKLLASA